MARVRANKDRKVSTRELAELTGHNERTVRDWASQGCPHERKGRAFVFPMRKVLAWLSERGYTGKRGRQKSAPPPAVDADGNPLDAETRFRLARAVRSELQAEQMRGNLIPREEVEAAAAEVIGAFVTAIRSVARTASSEWRDEAEALAERMVEAGLDRAKAALGRIA